MTESLQICPSDLYQPLLHSEVLNPPPIGFFFSNICTFGSNTKKILLQGTCTNKKYRYMTIATFG